MLRNTLRYLLSNIYDFSFNETVAYKDMVDIDKWALNETKELIDAVTEHYMNYNFHMIYHTIYNFCTVKMSSIYLDILKDRMYTFAASSKERRSAQTAMHMILSSVIRLMAPILSFTAEESWGKMPGAGGESVHLTEWPELKEWKVDKKMLEDYGKLFGIREKALAALEEKRQAKVIGSPLEAKVTLKTGDKDLYNFLKKKCDELPAILIVSQVEVVLDASAGDECAIDVVKAEGEKCQRCWNYRRDIGKDKDYTDLCARCAVVVRKFAKEVE